MFEAGLFNDMHENNLIFSYNNHMAVYMLTEINRKKEDPTYKSVHEEWFKILPKDMDDFPVCYPEGTMTLLEGTEVKSYIEDRVRDYKADYEYIAKHVPDMKQFHFNEFRYCNLISSSRSFDLVIDGVKTRCMVPYADMINHKNPPETKWFFD